MAHPLIIHATPPLAPLPASDTESIYLIAVAQSVCAGRWGLTTANWGDNGGNIPYVTHLDHRVPAAHLHAIPSFPHPDEDLTKDERAEALSWVAYVDERVTDLVNHSLYSLPPNYPATIAKSHVSTLSFPQSVYIPQRLRGMHKARLQHVGLWGLGGMNEADLAEDDRKRLEEVYVQAPGGTVAPRAWSGWRAGSQFEERRKKLGEQELLRRAKDVFEILDRRLGTKPYFFSNKPSSADLRLFANLALILDPALPNSLLPAFIQSTYPALVAHYDRLKWSLFGPDSWSIVPVVPPKAAPSLWADLPSFSPLSWLGLDGGAKTGQSGDEQSEKSAAAPKRETAAEKAFKRGRWMWYAGALGAMVVYVFGSGLVKIEFGGDDDEDEDEVADGWTEVGPEVEVVMVDEEEGAI